MGRNIHRLRAFIEADRLVIDVYATTRRFPAEERFGLQAQIRRAAVSIPCNLVEGGERRTTRDFLHFVATALGSASEVRYLVTVARRLELVDGPSADDLENRYMTVIGALQKLITSLEHAP
jgi:four helix bundle protein